MVDQVKPANHILESFQQTYKTKSLVVTHVFMYVSSLASLLQAASYHHAVEAEGRNNYYNSSLQRSRAISYTCLVSHPGIFQIQILCSKKTHWEQLSERVFGNFALEAIILPYLLHHNPLVLEADNQNFHPSCHQDFKKHLTLHLSAGCPT